MAIYHMHVTVGSKRAEGGQSAAAKYDYLHRSGRYKKDSADPVVYSVDHYLPNWAKANPRDYWAAADEHERDKGVVFRQVEFALPKELNAEQREQLALRFASQLAAAKEGPLPFSLVIHDSKKNPHAHLMLHERALDDYPLRTPEQWFKRANKKHPERGGAAKATSLQKKDWLFDSRKRLAQLTNEELKRAGFQETIDHRSNRTRRLGDATWHLGHRKSVLENKGIETIVGNINRNIMETRDKMARLKEEEFKAAARDAPDTVINAEYYAAEIPQTRIKQLGIPIDLDELVKENADRRALAEAREKKEEARRREAEAEEQKQQEHQHRRNKTAQAVKPVRQEEDKQENKQRDDNDEGRGGR